MVSTSTQAPAELVGIQWVQDYLHVSRMGAYLWLRRAEEAGAITRIVLSERRHRWSRAELEAHVLSLRQQQAQLTAQRRRQAGLAPEEAATPQVQLRRRRARTPTRPAGESPQVAS